MILIDEPLLDRFRQMTRCENCDRRVTGCDPAHIMTRGAGRVDLAINVVGLCRRCHSTQGTPQGPSLNRLKLIAAVREGILPEDIETEVHRIRALPKPLGCSPRRPKRKWTRNQGKVAEALRERQKQWAKAIREKQKAARKLLRKNPGMS